MRNLAIPIKEKISNNTTGEKCLNHLKTMKIKKRPSTNWEVVIYENY